MIIYKICTSDGFHDRSDRGFYSNLSKALEELDYIVSDEYFELDKIVEWGEYLVYWDKAGYSYCIEEIEVIE